MSMRRSSTRLWASASLSRTSRTVSGPNERLPAPTRVITIGCMCDLLRLIGPFFLIVLGYIGRLHMVGSADLVRAWVDGDWTAVEGAFFDCWNERKHVIRPFEISPGLDAVSVR